MSSQEEKVEGQQAETTAAEDAAELSRAWDEIEAEESGQSAPAAEHLDDEAKVEAQGGGEAGQGEAEAGQPEAVTTPGADADKASRGEISDDVLANADPALKARLELLEEEKRKAQNLARSNGSRLAQALSKLHALSGSGKPAEGDDDEAEKAKKEKLGKVREDFEELNPLVDEVSELREQVGKLKTKEVADATAEVEAALEAEFEAVKERHADFTDIVKAPEYAEWVKAQPPGTQRIVQDNAKAVVSAADVVKVFDDFKRETKWGQAPAPTAEQIEADRVRKEQLEAGRGVTGSQPGVRSDATGKAETFDAAWDELDRKDKRTAQRR